MFTVTAVESSVIGPNPVQFRYTLSTASSFPIYARYSIHERGNIENGRNFNGKFTFPAFETEKIIEISDYTFVNNYLAQSGTLYGYVSSSIHGYYTIPNDYYNRRAEVEVRDDGSLPIISISAVDDTVDEPNPAKFRLTASNQLLSRCQCD